MITPSKAETKPKKGGNTKPNVVEMKLFWDGKGFSRETSNTGYKGAPSGMGIGTGVLWAIKII